MARCSLFSVFRSDSPVRVAGIALTAVLSSVASTALAATGSVAGSVSVAGRAALRSDGPKHDLDVVIALEPIAGTPPPALEARVSMDQKGLVFLPHVLAIQTGTTVTFLNNDPDDHNVYFLDDETGETLDIGTWGSGVSVDHRFERAGMVITLCKLHLEMAAYIVVLDTPWFTTVRLDPEDHAARFAIEGVPPGDYRLVSWSKKLRQAGEELRVSVAEEGVREVQVEVSWGR